MCRARRAGYKSRLMRGDVYDIAYKLTCSSWVVAEFLSCLNTGAWTIISPFELAGLQPRRLSSAYVTQ